MAVQTVTKPPALDETLQGTNTALGLLAKDTTVTSIVTALALLGKDTSIQAVVTALGLLNKDATMVTQNSKLDTIIAKLQGIIEALGVDTSIYKAAGNKACADLTSSLLVAGNLGNVYNITDNGTTTADFVEGAGKSIHLGNNVAVVDIGESGSHVYKFDLLSGLVDLSNYIQKSETAGLIKNDGTIDTKDYAEKASSATNGNLAGLNATGNPTDSGISGDMTTNSATGNPISIADLKSAQIVLNPIITFEPIQAGSGTPSPSNIRVISGYDKIEVLSCGRGELQADENGARNASTGAIYDTGIRITTSNFIKIKANEKYFIHIEKTSSAVQSKGITFSYAFWYNNSTTNNSRLYDSGWTGVTDLFVSYTTDTYLNVIARYTDDSTIDANHVNIYVTSYKTTDLSESLGQTVYGGTYDVRTGLLTVTHGIVDLGTLTWTKTTSGITFFYANGLQTAGDVGKLECLCSIYATEEIGQSTTNDKCVCLDNNGVQVRVRDNDYSTKEAFATAVSGVMLVYKLVTPFTIQLTPHEIALSQGYNYISTNGTSISLAYHNGEVATHADVEQLAETVNELGMNLLNVVEDVTSKFVLDSTNVYTSTMQVLKIGKMVFINGSIRPQALTSLQNKKLFDITDNRLLPLVGASANITANFVPVETAQSTTLPLITIINSSYSQLRTSNNSAYGGITNITTSSLIFFSGAYVCKG